MILTTDEWTIVAISSRPGFWDYEPGVTVKELLREAHNEVVLLMHRKARGGWVLVARLAPPAWRHVKRWRDRHPLTLPAVREHRA